MFLSNFVLHDTLEKVNLYIDEEVNHYFINLEKNLLKFISKSNRIYNLQKSDILRKTINNLGFEEFIYSLVNEITRQLNINYIEAYEEDFVVNLKSLSDFKLNSTLLKQYNFSHFAAKNIEETIDKVIENNLFDRISNRAFDFILDNLSSSEIILSFANLSSDCFNKRHSIDIERRLKGILVNFKIRLKNELKSQVYNHVISLQILQHKSA